MSSSDTAVRTIYTKTFNFSGSCSLKDMTATTSCSNNDGYLSFYLNNTLITTTQGLSTSWTVLADVSFIFNANAVLYVKTGWKGSHSGNTWGFKGSLTAFNGSYEKEKVIEEKYFTINNVKYGYFRYIKS